MYFVVLDVVIYGLVCFVGGFRWWDLDFEDEIDEQVNR